LHTTTSFEISRELTKQEQKDFDAYSMNIMLESVFEEKELNKEEKQCFAKIKKENKKLEAIPYKTISVYFTNLLPHFYRKT